MQEILSMEITKHKNDTDYESLILQITELVAQSKQKALRAVNTALVEMNWYIGKYIVEFEQNGNTRAEYGTQLIPQLSKDLTLRLGNGYSRSNLANMRLLYLRFPIFQTVSGKLSWSHFIELIGIDNELERNFYLIGCFRQNWSVRELRTQCERLETRKGKTRGHRTNEYVFGVLLINHSV